MRFEERMKSALLERAVSHAVLRGRKNPVRTARNLAEMASHLWQRPAPEPDDPALTRMAEALEAGDREGLLTLLYGKKE